MDVYVYVERSSHHHHDYSLASFGDSRDTTVDDKDYSNLLEARDTAIAESKRCSVEGSLY